jgi:glycosyltransferase involved in cell wall biosynthesis
MPKITVIIPNYNHEKFLAKRIDSVLNQTYQDFDIIILDDNSADGSKDVIERYRTNGKVSNIVYNDTNSGSTFKQWKKGFELAEGEYIWIAESDDYAAPNFLETLIKPFEADPGVVISYCRSLNVDENNQILGIELHADTLDKVRWTKDYVEDGKVEVKKYLKYRNTIPNASAVVFKRVKNIANFLRTDMRFCGDWLFWRDILKHTGGKIAYSHATLNFFRTHPNTTRYLTASSNIQKELKRFREYKSFVPLFISPFDDKFRWMMAEWIDRGVSKAVKNTRYQFLPLLHPALILRYYLFLVKKKFSFK